MSRHALLERGRALGPPALVDRLVEQVGLPEAAVAAARHGARQMVAAGTGEHDLVEGQRLVVDGQLLAEGAGVAGELVAEHEGLVGALQPRLEVADVVQQRRPAELAEDGAHGRLGRRLLVEELAVGVAGVGPARQAVPARQVDARLVAQGHARRPVRFDHGAHVEHADAGAVEERRAGVGELVHDEAGEHLGVGDHDDGRDRRRRRRARRRRRRQDHRHLELAADEELVEAALVELQGRRRHGQAGQAAGLAAGRRHLGHDAQRRAAERARDDDRLARAGQHGGELGEVDALGVDVARAGPST